MIKKRCKIGRNKITGACLKNKRTSLKRDRAWRESTERKAEQEHNTCKSKCDDIHERKMQAILFDEKYNP